MANFKPAMSASRQKLTWDERPLLAQSSRSHTWVVACSSASNFQNGVPRRGVVRLRQDLTVVSKVLFVNVAIHSKPRSLRRERYRTLSHRKMPQVGR
jgi:hypothetical protein